jgi:hypothetical protein
MIFSHDYQDKTQTRRLKKPGQYAQYYHTGTRYPSPNLPDRIIRVYEASGRIKWEAGRTYAMQRGRGLPAYARMKVLAIREQRLQDISHKDALEEGVKSWAQQNSVMHALHFIAEGFADAAYADLWRSLHKKTGTRYEDNPIVWALAYEVAE